MITAVKQKHINFLPAGPLVDDINVFDFAPGEHTATFTVNDTLGTSDSESFNFTTGKYNGKNHCMVCVCISMQGRIQGRGTGTPPPPPPLHLPAIRTCRNNK